MNDWELETLALRVGELRTDIGSHSEPIFLTSSFVFESAQQAADRFAGRESGVIYSRFTNPTVQAFEQRLAALEKADRAIATSSGMAAILTMGMAYLRSGDRIVVSRNVFGTTHVLFNQYFTRFGVEAIFVDLTDLSAWKHAVNSNTKLLFIETPSNPLNEIADIPALAEIAKGVGAKLVVDNCLCTPALQQPLLLGADIVIHSATKYLDGQGRVLGGALVGNEQDMQEAYSFVRSAGPSLSPFNAWVLLKGLETLTLRMEKHSQNALAIAQWLAEHSAVSSVYYSGLEAHPQYALARKQQIGAGGVLSFELKDGQTAAWKLIDQCKIFSITANLGDAKSTITHPDTTTHGRLPSEEKIKCGITEGLVRLSVGLENVEDLRKDLEQGLK
ncbi:MAG: O-succinylhomoserine sulfhydrylase [Pseudomonadota bacterium]